MTHINKNYLKVEDHPDLVRDPHSKAILQTDQKKLEEHRAQRNFFKSLKEQQKEVQELRQEMSEIKELLVKLLHK